MCDIMKIKNRKDLETFRNRVHNGETSLNAEFLDNIDVSCYGPDGKRINWEPIGTVRDKIYRSYNCSYKGVFNGNGHIISGLYINNKKKAGLGLFSYLLGAHIKDLTVEGEIIGSYNVGGIAGYATSIPWNLEHRTVIENCVNNIKCTGTENVAGICGYSEGPIIVKNCVNNADIYGLTPTGIIGNGCQLKVKDIISCRNKGNLFTSQSLSMLSVENSNSIYNQIIQKCREDIGDNTQSGQVIFTKDKDNNSLLGLFFKYYRFDTYENQDYKDMFFNLIKCDKDPLYKNKNGDTYLHLLCKNKHLRTNNSWLMNDLILMLATETNIDFEALNNDGKEAASFLHNTQMIKLIEEIKKEKTGLDQQEDETFSDIGW